MGADGDPMAALDARMRVRVIEGLRVADMSAVPDIKAGNTNAPEGNRCAGFIWERRKNAAPRHASEPFVFRSVSSITTGSANEGVHVPGGCNRVSSANGSWNLRA